MALGGGTFITQNKVLPGTYHNFISAQRAYLNLSDRGFVALPIVHDAGKDGEVVTITAEDFKENTLSLIGYDYTHEKAKPFREIFRNAHTIYAYFLKGSTAAAATNTFSAANFKGERGNALKTVITANVDEPSKFDVQLYLDTILVDEQKAVASAAALVDNPFVTYKKNATLAVTAGTPLSGGTNGTVTPVEHQKALDEYEAYGFNILTCAYADAGIRGLYEAYTKRLRDEVGSKFQVAVFNSTAPNHESVIDVHNNVDLVYWTAGAEAGCAINASTTNKLYDGEYEVTLTTAKTQSQLTALLKAGKFVFHKVGTEVRVLEDINSLVTFTETKNEDFKLNQVIRVIDQDAIDMAHLFNTRYLGKVPNDKAGRVSLWSDVVTHDKEMERLRAIENYNPDETSVAQGNNKKSVVINKTLTPVVAMTQLYITTVVA